MRGPSQQITIEGDFDQKFAQVIQQEVELGVGALQHGQADMAVAFFSSARSKVSSDFPFYDHLTHNLLLAYKARIEQLFAQQRVDDALAILDNALGLNAEGSMAGNDAFLQTFADTYHNLGLVCFENSQFQECILCSRKAIAIRPCPTYSVNLTNSLAILNHRPDLSDFSIDIGTEGLGRHIFIACVPKSASTFLKNVLVGLTGYRDLFSVFAAGQNEHDLYLPVLSRFADQDTVTQQHARASDANVQLMQALGIRPVILVRNIFDSIVSLHDFYIKGAFFSSYFRESFMTLPEEDQIDLLIDNFAPWYLQFVASWAAVDKKGSLETLWLTYEALTTNKAASTAEILKFYGLGASQAAIERTISRVETDARRNRFNKGVAGRGVKKLTNLQRERIIGLTRYNPQVDFGIIGL